MNIFEHFACHTLLPIKLRDVRDHILETGLVSKIIRFPVELDQYVLLGGYHQFRMISPPYVAQDFRVARIGYPKNAGAGLQRLVCVKEMLHILDPHEATSPTKEKVEQLVNDLIVQGASKEIGIPAEFDHRGLLLALCVLLSRDALDELRSAYDNNERTVECIAREAMIPNGFAKLALTDEWLKLVDHIQ